MTEPQPPVAGWYADPLGQGRRYWDGCTWTTQVRQVGPAAIDLTALPAPALLPEGHGRPSGEPLRAPGSHRCSGERTARTGPLRHPLTWLLVALVVVAGALAWSSAQHEERPPVVVTPVEAPGS